MGNAQGIVIEVGIRIRLTGFSNVVMAQYFWC